MREKIIIAALLINLHFQVEAQCPNGITTNPLGPINNQLPSKTNTFFNWTQQFYQSNNSCQALQTAESPFFKIDNIEKLRFSKDMKPEDGWELLRWSMGYTEQNNPVPSASPEHTYYILYNKYNAIVRVLLKTCRGADYNGAKITIKFNSTSNFQTSLFDLISTVRPLDLPFSRDPVAASVTGFPNDNTKWFYADFPVAYDPCTCLYNSKIEILSHLISQANITLAGSITGTIASITGGQGSVSGETNIFKDIIAGGEKFKKLYDNVDKFILESKNVAATLPNSAQTQADLETLRTKLKDIQFLKTGLSLVPWLKSAVGLIDFFSGGGKTDPQTTQLMPLSANLSVALNGTMTTANPYHSIVFTNPGSQNAVSDPDIYPYYNEVLGVFNLINGPKGTYSWLNQERGNCYYKFKLTQPIKWVLNPSSDLELQDAKVAFVGEFNIDPTYFTYQVPCGSSGCPPQSVGQGFDFLEGKDAISNKWVYRTEYVDINCLGLNNLFNFTYNCRYVKAPYKLYMKFMINLRRISNPSAQNVLLVLKYPITMGTGTLTGVPFDPNACTGGAISQATPAEVTSFCTSGTYTNNRQRGTGTTVNDVNEIQLKDNFIISPNPANSVAQVTASNLKKDYVSMKLVNLSGGTMWSKSIRYLPGQSFSESITFSNLSGGVYILIMQSADGQTVREKIVLANK